MAKMEVGGQDSSGVFEVNGWCKSGGSILAGH